MFDKTKYTNIGAITLFLFVFIYIVLSFNWTINEFARPFIYVSILFILPGIILSTLVKVKGNLKEYFLPFILSLNLASAVLCLNYAWSEKLDDTKYKIIGVPKQGKGLSINLNLQIADEEITVNIRGYNKNSSLQLRKGLFGWVFGAIKDNESSGNNESGD